jgi:hypothetical protein
MTTDPSMQVTDPVPTGTTDPRGGSVERLGGFGVKIAIVDGTENEAEAVARSDATVLGSPVRVDIGLGMQKYPFLQLSQAQPYPHRQSCAGVCGGGQNQPSGHSEHEYPAFGHGWREGGEIAGHAAVVEALKG